MKLRDHQGKYGDIRAVFLAAADAIKPLENITVSGWADKKRILSSDNSEPGRWRTSRTPYLRGIMDALSPSDPCQFVTFMKGTQIGGTEAGNNWWAYQVDYNPAAMLIVQPTDDLVQRVSKQRLTKIVESTPAVEHKVVKDNIHEKIYPGGITVLATAKSAAGLRSMPVKYLMLDEVDGYSQNVQGEGDPVKLAIARTSTFPDRKVYRCSTPVLKGHSNIESAFLDSNRSYYHVPCMVCGVLNVIKWPQIKWPKGEPENAVWECPDCGHEHREHDKTQLLADGQWIAECPEVTNHKGFHLSSLYAPFGWRSWGDCAREWEAAQGDTKSLQTFVNTVLGETWEVRGESPDWVRLYDRRETYQIGTVPKGALVLTAGVDVQKDRIEVEVVGWGEGLESWSVSHEIIAGDPYQKETWSALAQILTAQWPRQDGGFLEISTMAVDSGFATTEVYKWARNLPSTKVMIVKGQAEGSGVVLGRTSEVEPGVWLNRVNVDQLKSEIYGLLRLDPEIGEDGQIVGYPPGYCHYPMYGQEFFEQLTAEEKVIKKDNKGFEKAVWVQKRARNEALDLRNYARAAAERLQLSRYQKKHWDMLRLQLDSGRVSGKRSSTKQPGRRERRDTNWFGR